MPNQTFKCWECQNPVAVGSKICGHCETHQLIAKRYKPVDQLGEGQFGIVYKAYHVDHYPEGPPVEDKGFVAIKVFKAPTATGELIHNELKLLHNLPRDNPNLVRISDDTCREYVVMEFIDGSDLHSLVRTASDTSDPEKQATAAANLEKIRVGFDGFLTGLCHGLAGIHTAGMIHRDLKPKNILVTTEGLQPKIVDMGLGKFIAGSTAYSRVGSLEIMAPEVLNAPAGTSHGTHIDIWALGVVIYFLWSSVYPFGNQIASGGRKDKDWIDYNELIGRVRTENPIHILRLNAEVPTAVADLIIELLEKNPRVRFASAQGVVNRMGKEPYESTKDPSTYKIPEYQEQLSKLYAKRNTPLPAADFLGHALGHVSYVYNAHKTHEPGVLLEACKRHLPRVFAWLCALVESAGWSVVDIIPFKYDNKCPYCKEPVCTMRHPIANAEINNKLLKSLREERRGKHVPTEKQGVEEGKELYGNWTFSVFADMFQRIYGKHNNQLKFSEILDHFHSETDEFFEAMYDATERRDPDATAIMFLELADLFAWFFAFCNALEVEEGWFEKAFWDTYKECPGGCGTIPCSCPPVEADLSLRNWRLSEATLREYDISAPEVVSKVE